MLNISNFDVDTCADSAILAYYGQNHYTITEDRYNYAVHVEMLDEDGNATPGETYAASALSTAIAIIERLETGEAE